MKEDRRQVLKSIIEKSKIRTQDELVKALKDKGVSITQATLSRDLKEIGAIKMPEGNGFRYKIHDSNSEEETRKAVKSSLSVESAIVSGQLCVLKCRPGFASAVAAEIDRNELDGLMGTIAGDDTVFVALKKDCDSAAVESRIKSIFNIVEIEVRVAQESDTRYADVICAEIFISSQERKTGIARRTPEYIKEKILAGKAVIATTHDGKFAGFSYIESWGGKSFVANSGLIVAHEFRGLGIAKRIKEQTFLLSRKLFPDAKIFSITTGAAVMKMNYEFGFRPVPYSELTDDPEFWKGCEGCRHFEILKSHDYKMCICTGLLYNPNDNLTIHHPDEK